MRGSWSEAFPLLTERTGSLPRPAIGKAVVLWVAVGACRLVASLGAPTAVAEYSVVLWALGLLPVAVFGYHRGAVGAWSAAGGLGLLILLVELVVLRGAGVGPALITAVVAALAAAAATARVVTALQKDQQAQMRAVLEDPESGLLTRRGLDLVLERELGEARRGGQLSVVMLALDGYEALQEENSAAVRAQVLDRLGEALTINSRTMDTVGRFEENRFLAVLPDTGHKGASTFAERVCTKLASIAVTTNGGSVVNSGVKARAGLATWSETSDEGRGEFLGRAQRALQLALSGEHGRVVSDKHARMHEVP